MDRLAVPVTLVVPANHAIALFNIVARLLHPCRRYTEAFGTDLGPEFENEDIIFTALKSKRSYRHVDGALSSAQIARVANVSNERHRNSGAQYCYIARSP